MRQVTRKVFAQPGQPAAQSEQQAAAPRRQTFQPLPIPPLPTKATTQATPRLPLPLQYHPQTTTQPSTASGGCCFSTCLRYLPVWLVGCSATVSGVPTTTISPPLSPPSGPRSMIQSAQRITSRLCSFAKRSLSGIAVSEAVNQISQYLSQTPQNSP